MSWWLRSWLNGSAQMLQRYQHLRLAMHKRVLGYDSLMREARKANWNALLPPLPPGGPKLVILAPEPLQPVLLNPSTAPTRLDRRSQLNLRLPPLLEIVADRLVESRA